ncbi:MAG TPA: prepilin-type N-terminal cleavage/methylation domain-containing protein [Verrucomicrobiae bacterium]|nr:prepilin-type N-terminal cleavage/methylation domain-containing protein [Verrucomicrobiae bacterium]
MGRSKGFSLIELLIVVAIILIIAAIAIPNLLQARLAANESSAAGSIHAITSAEITYFNAYPTVGYAVKLQDLGGATPCTITTSSACLIDNFLATAVPGGSGKAGYYFLATGIMNGGATFNDAYVIGAAPITVHSTGNRDFCSTNDGVLRSEMGTGGTPANALATCLAFPVAQ